ncbi:hypothetical protein Nepgr_016382 [Nepenthes gracilis]|uniref:Uncharacterized protein n=1 Tax=Nepenthes gracilis TaxID=150966 RepID=A0AAD3SQE1_NEPGR|nr:hypothetical protein Nepgr_016382 [Nepenthes gracilis]
MESPNKSLRFRPSAGKSPRTGALSNICPQSSSFSAGVPCELGSPDWHTSNFYFRGDLLGVFDPGSEPGEILLDGEGSLSPGVLIVNQKQVVHQSAVTLHERPQVSDAEFSSGLGILGVGVALVQTLSSYSRLLPISDPKIYRQQLLLDSQSCSQASKAVRIGCEDYPELPSLDVEIVFTLESSSRFSYEPPWWRLASSKGLRSSEGWSAEDIANDPMHFVLQSLLMENATQPYVSSIVKLVASSLVCRFGFADQLPNYDVAVLSCYVTRRFYFFVWKSCVAAPFAVCCCIPRSIIWLSADICCSSWNCCWKLLNLVSWNLANAGVTP